MKSGFTIGDDIMTYIETNQIFRNKVMRNKFFVAFVDCVRKNKCSWERIAEALKLIKDDFQDATFIQYTMGLDEENKNDRFIRNYLYNLFITLNVTGQELQRIMPNEPTLEYFDSLAINVGACLERYLSLCGVYFRFPDGDIYAMFYDDDYSGDVSLNSWLKSKYTGPEYNETLDDLYYENQIKVEEFRNSVRYPSDDNMEHLITDDVQNKLIERLTLMDYLILPGGACDAYRGQLEGMLKKIENSKPEMIDRWTEYISNPERYWSQLEELHDFSTIRFQSQSNYIEYYYDYGDDWKVNITCTNVYFDDYSDEIDAETVDQVIAEHRPICVKSDGLDLIEDVGGVSGFVEFLTTSSDPSNKNFESSNEWAANRGWSRRKTSPKRKI